ncbi:MAG TPA: hypothetical protein DHV36_23120 [Desulfobacteraceae bacterium]|nr:hypothetical protein [Desulfobacteraceae bacterium]
MAHPPSLNSFTKAIKENCHISDAGGASIFSICGMALRLRDLNKWEQGLYPWQEAVPSDLLEWIDNREQIWESVGDNDYSPLPLNGRHYDPFDTRAINRILHPQGLFYGAGYAHSLKPCFFLARILETRDIQGIPVLILGQEMVRDLLTLPALNQDDAVIFRKDAAALFLWDQMAYLKKSGQRFLRMALRRCGLPDPGTESRIDGFESILSIFQQTCIHHEIGEICDTVFDRSRFRQIVAGFPHSTVELLARTVKDLLADTGPNGTLAHIIETKNAAALGFYAAFQDGLFRPLFPQLRPAVEKFVSDDDWDGIENTRGIGFDTARRYVEELLSMLESGDGGETPEQTIDRVNTRLVVPLNNGESPITG